MVSSGAAVLGDRPVILGVGKMIEKGRVLES